MFRIERIQCTAVSNFSPEGMFNDRAQESISPADGESRLEKLGTDATEARQRSWFTFSGWIVARKDENPKPGHR
jgi:hypothetical protein